MCLCGATILYRILGDPGAVSRGQANGATNSARPRLTAPGSPRMIVPKTALKYHNNLSYGYHRVIKHYYS